MYIEHFGLTEAPFSITPDPRYVYLSARHREALAHLLYGIRQGGGFVQLTGDVGTGKTTLCRCLLEQLPPEVDVALILNPRVSSHELLATVCDELRIAYPPGTTSLKVLVDALYQHLLSAHERGRRTVLILDEAQNLSTRVLEQVRLLTNLETAKDKLLQIILIGQPELIEILDGRELRQLAQRVTARYHLQPCSREETRAYIVHRLGVAGRKEPIFSETALREVYRESRGVPRLINVICDRALLGAYANDTTRVDARMVRRAAREVRGRTPRRAARSVRWAAVGGVAVLAVAAALLLAPRPFPPLRALWTVTQAGWWPSLALRGAPGPGANGRGREGGDARSTGVLAPAPPVRLADVLADSSMPADKRSAFVSLYARWGVAYPPEAGGLACEHGRAVGLRCLFRTGTWAKLRRFDLPAIVELTTPTGERRYATVAAVAEQTATLDFGGRAFTFAVAEIDPHWEGVFILLWKAPTARPGLIWLGQRGREVEWIRRRLSEIDGSPVPDTGRDVYDADLADRVRAFQRSRWLVADGIVGEETFAHLTAASRDPEIPLLSKPKG